MSKNGQHFRLKIELNFFMNRDFVNRITNHPFQSKRVFGNGPINSVLERCFHCESFLHSAHVCPGRARTTAVLHMLDAINSSQLPDIKLDLGCDSIKRGETKVSWRWFIEKGSERGVSGNFSSPFRHQWSDTFKNVFFSKYRPNACVLKQTVMKNIVWARR